MWRYEKLSFSGKWSTVTVPEKPEVGLGVDENLYIKKSGGTLEGPIRNLHEVGAEPMLDMTTETEQVPPPTPEICAGSPDAAYKSAASLLLTADPNNRRTGLWETPSRFAKAWEHYTSGYNQSVSEILKVFEDGAENYEDYVLVKDIQFYSLCEHHLAPIIGTAHIAYQPNGRIVGLSKLARVVEIHARRLQVQERITVSIANDLMEHLRPKGCGVIIEARHLCMEMRGVQQRGTSTITQAYRGNFSIFRNELSRSINK